MMLREAMLDDPVAVAVRTEEMCSRLPANQRQTMCGVDSECNPMRARSLVRMQQRAATDGRNPALTKPRQEATVALCSSALTKMLWLT
jgi:hypothetical protein